MLNNSPRRKRRAERRTFITVPCTVAIAEQIERAAEAKGVKTATFVRDAAERSARGVLRKIDSITSVPPLAKAG